MTDFENNAYLERLGRRVRKLRTRRGMSRKVFGEQAGISERYLALLETGKGNASILMLREVAYALGIPVEELVYEREEPSLDSEPLIQLVRGLAPQQVADAHRLLMKAFGFKRSIERMKRVALIGLRGAGKSTLGRVLAEDLDASFVELTKEIERLAGMPMGEIMALGGQTMLRRFEQAALKEIVARDERLVIAVGGSLVSEAATYDTLLSTCFTIWVMATPEEHMSRVLAQGDHRPMAGHPEAMADLRLILAERQPLYDKADAILNTAGKTVQESTEELIRLVAEPSMRREPEGAMLGGR